MKKEFIENLMVQMKTLETKLNEEREREKKEKEELEREKKEKQKLEREKNDWRSLVGNNAKLAGDINESIIISHLMKSGWDVFKKE